MRSPVRSKKMSNLHSFLSLKFIFLGALVALYEEAEKPNNAAEFVRRYMGSTGPETAEVESMKNELMVLRERNEELMRENEQLKEKLSKHEGGQ